MVDLLFEFDAPKRFVDLTSAYKYTSYHNSGGLSHDAWFDLAHSEHSQPTPSPPSSSTTNGSNDQNSHTNDAHKHDVSTLNRKKFNASTSTARLRAIRRTSGGDAALTSPVKVPIHTTRALSTTSRQSRPVSAQRPTTSSSSSMKRKAPVTAVKSKVDSDLQDLQALLAKHNKKFKSKHTYEPRQHSARDIKRWEQMSKKAYNKLSLKGRQEANKEIAKLKENSTSTSASTTTSRLHTLPR